jgi:hypothetical protein
VSRERELRKAISRANLPATAVLVYRTILDHADWETGDFPAEWQPRSLARLAEWVGKSEGSTARALNLLEEYGWIRRDRAEVPGRGRRTTYTLLVGRPRPGRLAMTGAERTRRYRQRKASQPGITPEPETLTKSRDEPSQSDVTNPRVLASQPQVNDRFRRGSSEGGEVGGDQKPTNHAADQLLMRRPSLSPEWTRFLQDPDSWR